MAIVPEHGVNAKVNLIVDTTNTDDVETSIDSFESSIEENWDVESESIFVSSSPTSSSSDSFDQTSLHFGRLVFRSRTGHAFVISAFRSNRIKTKIEIANKYELHAIRLD